MGRKRKRKGRLRVDRIIMVLLILALIITSIKLIPFIIYNNKIYNSLPNAKDNTVVINKKYNKLKLYNKTINYLKEHNLKLKVNSNKYVVIIDSKKIKKNMTLKIDKSNKKLEYKDYDKDKSLVIENNKVISNSEKISIKLPNYLLKNKKVDIYAVTKDKNIEPIELGIVPKNSKIDINLSNKYVRYFITYINVRQIKLDDISVYVDDKIEIKAEYIPKNATIKEFEYNKIGDIFVKENNNIIAKKEGIAKIVIKHKTQNLKESVTIRVKKKKEVKNNKNDEVKPKIEVKDGLTYVSALLFPSLIT